MSKAAPSAPCALVFRKRLLPYSETFIADQGKGLPNYRAIFAGLHQDDSGLSLLDPAPVFIMDRIERKARIRKLGFRLGFATMNRWMDLIREQQPDLVHAHFLNDAKDAAKLAGKLQRPLVATLHGHDITKPERQRMLKTTTRDFFTKVDRVIAVSDFIAQHALRKGCPEHKLVQHSIGIDLQRFTQSKQETDLPSLLFVGRLVEKKGMTYLLQAMEKLHARYPELYLTVVGDGPLREQLQAQASAAGLDVRFLGRQNAQQIRDLLASHWLFVAPSITADNGDAEGLGMVFLEAQALQTPVVSFSSGGVPEAVEDGKTGLLCQEKDVDCLALQISTLIDDGAARREMGLAGRARVEERFDLHKQCAKLEAIYDSLLRTA